MRSVLLLIGCIGIAGCALFDAEEDPPQATAPSLVLNTSCSDLWKHYTDEVQLINDDEEQWQTHDDRAVQYMAQLGGSCNPADVKDFPATEMRCKALWDMYVKEVGRMTKDNKSWRDHDLQQAEAMNRIRSNCTNTACTFLPGIRCLAPKNTS